MAEVDQPLPEDIERHFAAQAETQISRDLRSEIARLREQLVILGAGQARSLLLQSGYPQVRWIHDA